MTLHVHKGAGTILAVFHVSALNEAFYWFRCLLNLFELSHTAANRLWVLSLRLRGKAAHQNSVLVEPRETAIKHS